MGIMILLMLSGGLMLLGVFMMVDTNKKRRWRAEDGNKDDVRVWREDVADEIKDERPEYVLIHLHASDYNQALMWLKHGMDFWGLRPNMPVENMMLAKYWGIEKDGSVVGMRYEPAFVGDQRIYRYAITRKMMPAIDETVKALVGYAKG